MPNDLNAPQGTETTPAEHKLPAFPPEVLARAQEHAPRLLDALGAWLGLEDTLARTNISVAEKVKFAVQLAAAKHRAHQIVKKVVHG